MVTLWKHSVLLPPSPLKQSLPSSFSQSQSWDARLQLVTATCLVSPRGAWGRCCLATVARGNYGTAQTEGSGNKTPELSCRRILSCRQNLSYRRNPACRRNPFCRRILVCRRTLVCLRSLVSETRLPWCRNRPIRSCCHWNRGHQLEGASPLLWRWRG